ncbi:MAG: DUF6516 family protein [Chloroflexi bacterium]|nr:DUF6516 family protein [Chloroflexota bacterium]
MTRSITAYLDSLERAILASPAVSAYVVEQHEVTPTDGKLRIRARLQDHGLLEFFEYVVFDARRQIVRLNYSYHWQDADGSLLRRWDNVNHYRNLPYAPHHVHQPDGTVAGVAKPPDLMRVLTEIEVHLHAGGHL